MQKKRLLASLVALAVTCSMAVVPVYAEDCTLGGGSGTISVEWSKNETNHWHACDNVSCTSEQKHNYAEHSWSDGKCSTCEYECLHGGTFTYTKNDGVNTHKKVCNICGEEVDSAEACTGGTATCTTKATCSNCEEQYGDFGACNLEHKDAVEATCKDKGTKEYWECSVCKQKYKANEATEENKIDAPEENDNFGEHTLGTAATCKTKATCSVCGEQYGDFGACNLVHKDAVPANCVDKGTKEYWECSVCEKKYKANEATEANKIEAPEENENFGAHTPGTAPTCLTAQTCEVCGTEIASATGHTFGDIKDEVPSTCTTYGTDAYKECSKCSLKFAPGEGIYSTVSLDSVTKTTKPDHAYDASAEDQKGSPATCTAKAKCSTCGAEFGAEPEGHQYSDGKCTVCGAPEHTCSALTEKPAVPANCVDKGTKAYWECETCGQKYKENSATAENKIEAPEANDALDPANHKTEGITDYHRITATGHTVICGACDKAKGEEVAHDDPLKYYKLVDGHKKYCGTCGYTFEIEDHVYGEGTTCTTCGYIKDHEHSFGEEIIWVQVRSAEGEFRPWHHKQCTGCDEPVDQADCTFVNGVCTVCGLDDPDYVPSKPSKPSTSTTTKNTNAINNADKGEDVKVTLPANTTAVPAVYIQAAKKSGANIVIDYGDYTWEISNITENVQKAVDLKVTEDDKAVPADVVKTVTEGTTVAVISIAHDGKLGFVGTLKYNVKKANAGKYVNLYYYNETTDELELQGSTKIDKNGFVFLPFTHCSSYVLNVTDEPASADMLEDLAAGEAATVVEDTLPATTDAPAATDAPVATTASTDAAANPETGNSSVALLAIPAVIAAVAVVAKKRG